jgi:Bacterial Ig-like domain (group 3)/Calx-beta domain
VSSSVGTPTGTVQFKDGGSNLGSPVALSGGTASAPFSSLSSGNHNITAVYSGDTNFVSSTGTLSSGQTVNAQVGVFVNDNSVTEGDTGTKGLTFTVTLSAASLQTVSVNYQTANGTATVSDNDYQAASGTLTFNPGETNKTVTVQVNSDVKFEVDETLFVNLSSPVNSTVSDNQGLGTILNNDAQGGVIKFNAADYSVGEADGQVVLTVTRMGDTSSAASVDYSSADVTAKEHSDYSTAVGTVKFAAG